MKKTIITTKLDTGSFDSFVNRIIDYSVDGGSHYTCCVNVHMLMEAYYKQDFQAMINGADLNTPDGMPLAMAMRFFHRQKQERVAGMDLFPALLGEAEQKGLRVFFYGDTDEILEELCISVRRDFPDLQIAGKISPPFRELTQTEEDHILARINATQPNLVFVALGCPKQEKWMARHKGKIHASMIGLGNAFRAYLGYEKRAPRWMQSIAMEWCYRLIQNPKRLWKRYLITNTHFLFLLFQGAQLVISDNKSIS